MKRDIENPDDIKKLVNIFYERVLADEQIGPVYRETANLRLETHLTTMYNFWENIIFFTGSHDGNPINLHKHLHHTRPLNKGDFDRWKQLFTSTVDELFSGEKANLIKQRAINISGIIMEKVFNFQQGSKKFS